MSNRTSRSGNAIEASERLPLDAPTTLHLGTLRYHLAQVQQRLVILCGHAIALSDEGRRPPPIALCQWLSELGTEIEEVESLLLLTRQMANVYWERAAGEASERR